MHNIDLVAAFAAAVNEIGTPRFDAALLAAVEHFTPIDFIAGVTYREDEGLKALNIASRHALSTARSLTRNYLAHHFSFDPNYKELKRVRENQKILVLRHDPRKLLSRRYEERFYKSVGIVDKISYIWRQADTVFYINFYRLGAHGHYGGADVQGFETLAPLVAALVARHASRNRFEAAINSNAPLAVAECIVGLLSNQLSAREREVLSRVLLGMTNAGIALELGVAPTSVITFRKRAYQKLGIASQAELFSLGLRCLS